MKAWAETPFERLALLNQPAIDLYGKHGIDLSLDMLEIDVCAQHNNGGLYADLWWESTNIKRLYPIGEVNGSHGVSRPGCSALNAGQVGALRAATRIVGYGEEAPLDSSAVHGEITGQVEEILGLARTWTHDKNSIPMGKDRLETGLSELRQRMSKAAGPIRSFELVQQAYEQAQLQDKSVFSALNIPRVLLAKAFRLRHMLIAQNWYLFAIKSYLEHTGGSRGSYLVVDPNGTIPHPNLVDYPIKAENKDLQKFVQVVCLDGGKLSVHNDACRGIPTQSFWFERVWSEFKKQSFFDIR